MVFGKDNKKGKSSNNYSRIGQEALHEPIYLEFPTETNYETRDLVYTTTSIQELSDLVSYSNAIVQYEPTPTNSDYFIDVPVENVISSLNPLVEEAKQYLYAKGFTNQDVQNMLVQEGGTELDLIPFVMSLTQVEANQSVSFNYSSFFVNSASARKIEANDYVACAAIAIGADILWALSTSSASTWSIPLMTRAFGAVAKRVLGPIGVAIAVVSFGTCLAAATQD